MSPSYTRYFIPLGKTALIFFPSCPGLRPIRLHENCQQGARPEIQEIVERNENSGGYVAQITVKHAKYVLFQNFLLFRIESADLFTSIARIDIINEITAFFLAQYDITVGLTCRDTSYLKLTII